MTIPASQFVQVTPSVLSAGGSPLALNGLVLTRSYRIPVGQVLSFPSAVAVSDFFGPTSEEATIATTYFLGFDNSNIKPSALLFSQFNDTDVPAWLQSGVVTGITIPQLQALSGTLIVSVDGATKTSSTINLSTATSYSAAATLIQAGFAAYDGVTAATSTIAAGAATSSALSSITGDVFTTGASVTGAFVVGGVLSGTGVTAGTTILSQVTGTAGGVGTYKISIAQNVASTTITQSYGVLTVVAMTSGFLAPGQIISGGTIAANTKIVSQLTGTTGQAGTYVTSGGAQTVLATIVSAGQLLCTYDSVSGKFLITGGTPGAVGVIGFATGTLATSLLFTEATGAITSQGRALQTPSGAMTAVAAITQNWATFMTDFDPDIYGSEQKQAFAAWVNGTNNRYAYVAWDTDITPTQSAAATTSLGYILKAANSSGTIPIYAPDYNMAAFICGMVASIDFTETNGRITLAFKGQTGITPNVTDQTVYNNLVANGYNSYASVATANDTFRFFTPGTVTGNFKWADSYVDQIWLNNQFQIALMTLLTSAKSIPYNSAGYGLIRAACMDPINQGLNFGAFRPGVPLSALQAAQVNNSAGVAIDTTLTAQGWYLQILAATAQVRGNRTSPPMTFWYMDGGSVQQINLASIEIQ